MPVGWLPNENWIQRHPSDDSGKSVADWPASLKRNWNWAKLISYCAVLMLLCWQLVWAVSEHSIFGKPVQAPVVAVFLCVVLLGILPAVAILLPQKRKKTLLLVDDLDRVPPAEMLSIIESLMLMLDDKKVKERLQIAMLVEEDIVGVAIVEKYSHLQEFRALKKSKTSNDCELADTCPGELHSLVESNMQKLFLAHIRLRSISKIERDTIVQAYCNRLTATVPSESPAAPNTNGQVSQGIDTNYQAVSPIADRRSQPFLVDSPLTAIEVSAIQKAIDALDSGPGDCCSATIRKAPG